MKKLFGLGVFALLAVAALFVAPSANASTGCLQWGTCSVTTQISVTLTGGNICIWSSGVFDFGTYTVSSLSQTVTGAFVWAQGYFFVDDQKGSSQGYYTTLQMSGNLVGTWGEFISGSNVYVQAGSPELLAWIDNPRVYTHAGMSSYQNLGTARQFINRDTANNQGIIGKYGTLPQMQLVIPAYQGVGTYVGTMVFTLIEN